MDIKKPFRVTKSAGESFITGAGMATIIVSIVGAFVAMPIFVGFVVAGAIGALFACIGGYREAKQIEEERQKKLALEEEQHREYMAIKEDLDEIRDNLDLHRQQLSDPIEHHAHLEKVKKYIHLANARVSRIHRITNFSPRHETDPTFFFQKQIKSPHPIQRSQKPIINDHVFVMADNKQVASPRH